MAKVCRTTLKRRIIRYCHRMLGSKSTVVFDYYQHWIHAVHPLPDPIVVPINIDTQQADLAAEARRRNQVIDILGSDERTQRREIMTPIDAVIHDMTDILGFGIDHDS